MFTILIFVLQNKRKSSAKLAEPFEL